MRYNAVILWSVLACIGVACSDGGASGENIGNGDSTSEEASTGSGEEDTDPDDSASESSTGPEPADSEVTLDLLEVRPEAVSRERDAELTLIGVGFPEGMTVSLENEAVDDPIDLGAASVDDGGESAVVTLPADPERPQGLYDLTVTLPEGESATLEDALHISVQPIPEVVDVKPALAWRGTPDDDIVSDRAVQIEGAGFFNTPWVEWRLSDAPETRFQAVEVNFIDEKTLIAVVPSESEEMPVGTYHVWVTNPDQLTGQWIDGESGEPGGFEITDVAPPTISGITPVQSPFNADAPLTISGASFDADAEVAIVTPDGDIPLEITAVEDAEITTAIAANTVEIGLYPIRVTNPDGQDDVFYAFEAKNPTDGHFYGDFEPLPSALSTPRERLALTYGFDDYGSTHLYASGGLSADNSVLDDTETAAVSIHGEVSAWRPLMQWESEAEPRVRNAHPTPRNGHALVRVGGWIYAIGGTAADTSVDLDAQPALASVESARILGVDTTPEASPPARVREGRLPEGTWYYRVSAIGPWGEGLPSNEVQLLNSGGALELCWSGVTDATGYNIYRTVAANGRPGTARLIATEPDGQDDRSCFTDDGASPPAPGFVSPTLQEGGELGEGTWIYRLTAVRDGVESPAGHPLAVATEGDEETVGLRWQEVPDATYNIYRTAEAVEEISGTEETFLIASDIDALEWVDDGGAAPDEAVPADDGVAVLPVGSLGRWQPLENEMTSPREGLGATAIALGDRSMLYAVGGRPDASRDGYLASVEMAEVLGDGGLGEWSEVGALNTGRAFFPLLTNQPKGMSPLTPDPAPASADDLLMLFAVAGDEGFARNGQNSGITTIEAARIDPETGGLSDWLVQTSDLSEGRRTYAHGGAIIDDYLYVFPGVDTEQTGLDTDDVDREPLPLGSVSSRFEMVLDDPLSNPFDDLLTNYMSSNGGLFVPRSYYGAARVNAHVYLVGGNDGTGPIAAAESIRQ